MPFKTRKHKQAAAERRVKFVENSVTYSGRIVSEKTDNSTETKPKLIKESYLASEINYSQVRIELTKIALLAIFIIGLQLALKIFHLPIIK